MMYFLIAYTHAKKCSLFRGEKGEKKNRLKRLEIWEKKRHVHKEKIADVRVKNKEVEKIAEKMADKIEMSANVAKQNIKNKNQREKEREQEQKIEPKLE